MLHSKWKYELNFKTTPHPQKKKSTVVVFSKNNFSFLDLINKYFLSIYYIYNTMLSVWVKESYKGKQGKQYTELESHVGLLVFSTKSNYSITHS